MGNRLLSWGDIGDTHIMRWTIYVYYYIHPHFGYRLFVDVPECPNVRNSKCRLDMDGKVDTLAR